MSTILFVHSSSDLYGSDRSLIRTIESVKELSSRIIVCLPYHGPLVKYLEQRGCIVYVMRLGVMRRKYFNLYGIFIFLFSFISAFFNLYRITRKHSVDIIHSNTSNVLVGGLVSAVIGRPHIWHLREILERPVFLRKGIHWILAKMSSTVVAVSESTAKHFLKDSPGASNKTEVVYNGLEIQLYQNGDRKKFRSSLGLNEDDILVGMIARISHWKGQDLFLKTAQRIIPAHKKAYFLALGSPFKGMDWLLDDFRNEAKKLDTDRFIIHEFAENVKDYLAGFDIFVLPSTQPDPFPTTVLEAMATSNAILVNGHGGATEMIKHGESGLVVAPPNSVDSMCQNLEILLEDAELREKYGFRANQEIREKFSVTIYEQNIRNVFKKYLN